MQFKKLFFISLSISLIFLVAFQILIDIDIKEGLEFDLLAHFFGGICVGVILIELNERYKRLLKGKIVLLVSCLLLWEMFEHLLFSLILTDVYSFYSFEYMFEQTYIIDTVTDILAGMLGGIGIMYWNYKRIIRLEKRVEG